jgi:hypothetical protein
VQPGARHPTEDFEGLLAARKKNTDQIDDSIGAVDGRCNRGIVTDIGGDRCDLADIAHGLEKARPVRSPDRRAHSCAGFCNLGDDVATDKTGRAEYGNNIHLRRTSANYVPIMLKGPIKEC